MLKMFGRVYNLPISLLNIDYIRTKLKKGRLEEGNNYWASVRNKIISEILK